MKRIFVVFLIFWSSVAEAEEFVVVRLGGQMGNQMFSIAAGLSLALDHGAHLLVPDLRLRSDKDIPKNYGWMFSSLDTSDPASEITFSYREPFMSYQEIPYHPNMEIIGYFQSDRYFRHHGDEIRALYSPSQEMLQTLEERYPEILAHPNSVAVHVRTYDKDDASHKDFPRPTIEYFEAALAHFPEDALFVIFTDNMVWCKSKLSRIKGKRTFIYVQNLENYIIDFYLMSRCKHNVISHSSFSWWAAYLNPNPNKKVIAPDRWFTSMLEKDDLDRIPEGWIRLNWKGKRVIR